MQDMASVLFPSVTCFLSSNRLSQSLPDGAMAEKTVFRQMHRSLPTTASHVRMTMTVAGLPSRRQERGAFPLSAAPPFRFSSGALRHPTHFISLPFRLSTCMTMFLCRHFRRHRWSFTLQGKGNDGIRNRNFSGKNLYISQV